MTRWSTDHETIEVEIDRTRSLGLNELRALWHTTLRAVGGSTSYGLLVSRRGTRRQ